MKTIVVCAIFILELVSTFPFPEPAYYDTYEPQEIQIPTLSHSPDLYQQQQLYIKQQNDNIRRNYENLLRNQILTRPSYNIQPVLNTIREPYINSIPLQRPIQRAQYEAPLTPQYYPVQRQQPVRQYQPVQSQDFQVATEAHAEAGNSQGASQPTNNPYHYAQFNAENLAYHPRIQQVLASTPLQKRYLVLHPNGTIEHIDKIEHIVEQHPNYILLNAGSVTPQIDSTRPGSAQNPLAPQVPVAPVAPVPPNTPPAPNNLAAPAVPAAPVAPSPPTAPVAQIPNAPNAPVAPVAPNTPLGPNAPVTPAVSNAPLAPVQVPEATPVASFPPTAPAAPAAPNAPTAPVSSAAPNNLAAPNAPVAPVTAATQPNAVATPPVAPAPVNPAPAPVNPVPSPVNPAPAPINAAPAPVGPIPGPAESLSPVNYKPAPPPPGPLTGIVPGPKQTVQPPTGPTTALPPVTAQTAQPHVLLNGNIPPSVILNGTIPGPKPTVPPPTGPTTELPPVSAPTAQPPVWVTATATAIYPPPTTPLPPVTKTLHPTVTTSTPPPVTAITPVPPVTATATASATSIEVTTPVPSTTEDSNQLDCPTTVAPYIKPNNTKNDIDVLQVNGAKPEAWFRTKNLDFWEKLNTGDETFDVVYFFNVPRQPRVTKETITTIHADGTVVEEVTQTICDDKDSPPKIIRTITVTKPDGTQSTT